MKKILSSILCLAMCCTILCACGDSKDKDSNETTSAETTTEETTAEATTESIEDTTTETTTEVTTKGTTETVTEEVTTETTEATTEEVTTEVTTEEVVEEAFNKEEAIAKINKMVEAHDVLVDQNKEIENAFLNASENLNGSLSPHVQTSDSIDLFKREPCLVVAINYFYDYVNNNGEYYDFENYVKTHTYKEINEKYLFNGNSKFDSTETILTEAVGLIPYIKQSDNIEYGDLVEENKITMEQANVAYSMTMKCDDNGGDFIALYDIDGNILNIIPANDNFDGYITTF